MLFWILLETILVASLVIVKRRHGGRPHHQRAGKMPPRSIADGRRLTPEQRRDLEETP